MNRLLVAILSLLLPVSAAASEGEKPFAVTNARIFDGERLIPRGTVVVKDGRIESVGTDVKIPEGAERIDAGGGTLLPGFIDAHTHAFLGGLDRALLFGVTTELDMGTLPAVASHLREEQNPGTIHGASLHREMELLVQAGLTPELALTAATSAPAKAFRLNDRGRIAPGLRADLVLVAGDPLEDITETRNIVRVWKGGVATTRTPAPAPAPPRPR